MIFSRRKVWIASTLFAMTALAAAFPLLGDTHTPQTQPLPAFHCYCQCENNNGAVCLKKMCDLPKYEKRWWAVSCRKRPADPSTSIAPADQPKARPTHDILDAKR